jgi:hypothetical protein
MRTLSAAAFAALSLMALCARLAADSKPMSFPQAEISNKVIRAKLYLPDRDHGYYRGGRFDWSGVIESLTYQGHEYFGRWFPHYEPTLHDAIMGPVEEFRSADGALGFDQAKAGGYFCKIGVGMLRRPDDAPYSFSRTYQIANGGNRVVRPHADRVEFVHELNSGDGYAYLYQKTVRLAGGAKPELILEHSLKNTGHLVIDTSVYNHNFYMIDGQPSGPDFRVRFVFEPKAVADLKGLAEIQGNELLYKRELHPAGESVFSELTGFGPDARDNDIVVENQKTGAGVREVGNQPISLINFWSIRTTVCPEAYIHMRIEPGKTFKWHIVYHFFTLPAKAK